MAFPLFLLWNYWNTPMTGIVAGFYTVLLIVFYLFGLAEYEVRFWTKKVLVIDMAWLYFVLSLSVATSSIMFQYWGSQMIWIGSSFYIISLLILYLFGLKKYEIKIWNKKVSLINKVWFVLGFLILVSIVSTMIQYWGPAVQIILVLIVCSIIAFAIWYLVVYLKEKKEIKMLKIQAEEESRRLEDAKTERQNQENKVHKERNRILDEKFNKDKKIFLKDIEKSDSLNWKEVKRFISERDIPLEFFQKTPKFFEVSNHKKKILSDRSVVSFLLSSFNYFYQTTMDDNLLDATVDQFCSKIESELAYLKAYEGYSFLISRIQKDLDPDLLRKIDLNFKLTL
jgi:hypothetical protein